MQFAFKEWAIIVEALASGRQALIVRKGGIAEEGGRFRPEHSAFWLFPTHFHQSADSVKPEMHARLALRNATTERPDRLTLTHYVEVAEVFRVDSLEKLLGLDAWHVWSESTIRQRFAYRTPGLFVLLVRVFRADSPIEIVNQPEYDGCKTWVDLGRAYAASGEPVIDLADFDTTCQAIRRVLVADR